MVHVATTFRVDQNGVNALFSARGEVAAYVLSVGRRVEARAVVRAPVDKGSLRARRTTRLVSAGGRLVRCEVSFNVDYAAAVHDGTRPHVIVPRNRKVLRFKVGGKIVYARRVNHPGTRPRPFLRQALADVAAGEGFVVQNGGT
jgi:hypothetical protein